MVVQVGTGNQRTGSKRFSMLSVDFEPRQISGFKGVFVSKARVLPNIDGIFQVSVLNVNETDVIIYPRKILGSIQKTGEVICNVENIDRPTSDNTELLAVPPGITYGSYRFER